MKTCETHQILLDKQLDGTIRPGELAELKAHAQACATCRAELDSRVLIENVVQDALLPRTSTERAKRLVLARISAEATIGDSPVKAFDAWLRWAREAVAGGGSWQAGVWRTAVAGVLLAIGFGLGVWWNGPARQANSSPTPEVALAIATLEGTVLVKHPGLELWQPLKTNSTIRLGDTFHCAAKSGVTLKMKDQSTIALTQNSMLVLKLFDGRTQFYLEHGQLAAALNSPHPPFVISTPHGQIQALGTEFTVTVE